MKSILKAIVMMALFASASAFATGTPVPEHPGANPPGKGTAWGCEGNPGKSDCQPKAGNPKPEHPPNNGGGGGQGGAAQTGPIDVDNVAKNWSSMSSVQRTEVISKLNADQRQQLQNSISLGFDVKVDGSKATSSSQGSSGNNTTTNIGGTNYNYSQPVASAFVQLPPGIIPNGNMVVTTTACGPDFSIEEVRKILATSSVGFGVWTTTRDNGVVSRTKTEKTGLAYGLWEVTGQDGDKLVEERMVNGYQAIIYAYLAGSSASSGLNLNGQNGAGAIAGSGGVQTFGKEIDKLSCSFKEVRKLSPVPVKVVVEQTNVGKTIAELDVVRTQVPGKIKRYQIVDKPKLCGGKTIPEGKTCVAVRENINVLEDVTLRAKSTSVEVKKK